ncbi:MAG: hypothetical protein QY302_08775 [Anaerolineales bacterium]|nr:MAG: hypothetical protein QY302_08775 [Anaerolineales bacterium]
MTVRVGKVTFSDWISLSFQNGWTDTFIFRIDARACIPPFYYEEPLRRMASHVNRKRPGASLWVRVDAPPVAPQAPGEWFMLEVRRSLKGLALPYAVTQAGKTPDWLDFSRPPRLFHSPLPRPPVVDEKHSRLSLEELRCLQALGRMEKGDEEEVASLAGLPVDVTKNLLAQLEEKELVVYKTSPKIRRGKSRPAQMDLFPLWHLRSRGLSLALRSWEIPKGIEFTSRKEENLQQIGYGHRHVSRVWTSWLKSAWPQAEILTGWSEVRIPDLSVIPDGLAWGRIQGYETLFWLEVGDDHKDRNEITKITTKRLDQARRLCERTGVRLMYTQLSTNWVHEAARWGCVDLPEEVAVVMGNSRRFGELPVIEWGKVIPN